MRLIRLPQLNYARDFARFLRLPLSEAQTRLIRDLVHQRQSRHCVRAFISDSPALSTPIPRLSTRASLFPVDPSRGLPFLHREPEKSC